MQAITTEMTATHDEGTYVVHVLQYGDHYVAFGRHHGNMLYIDVHGSKRVPQPGLFYVLFACSGDVVDHGIKVTAKEHSAYCRRGHESCPKSAVILHICKFRTAVTIMDIGKTILRDVTTHQLWAAVNEMFHLRPPRPVLRSHDDVDALLATILVGAMDTNWVDIMNERHATRAQAAKRAVYDCVRGHPLRVPGVPGNRWVKAHYEQRPAHKGYICTA